MIGPSFVGAKTDLRLIYTAKSPSFLSQKKFYVLHKLIYRKFASSAETRKQELHGANVRRPCSYINSLYL